MKALIRILFLVALGAAGALVVRNFAVEGIYIASDSMAPTLPQGTPVVVRKWERFRRPPARGEIVMFSSPAQDGKGLVKRVIAVGGDTLEIRNKQVFLNNEPLNEPYTQFLRSDTLLTGDNLGPLVIPDGHVFVMGDNRDVSGDSRDWPSPFLPVADITGYIHLST